MLNVKRLVARHGASDSRLQELRDAPFKVARVNGGHVCAHGIVCSPHETEQNVCLIARPVCDKGSEGRIGRREMMRGWRVWRHATSELAVACCHRNKSKATSSASFKPALRVQ